jgi:MFS family permease
MQDLNPLSRQREVLMCLMLVGTGIATIMFSLPLPLSVEPLVACPAMALLNFGLAVYQILWGTLVQETVPSEKLGRFSSIQQLGQYGLRSVGFALAGMIADHLSPRWVFIGAGALNLGLSSLRFLQVFRLDTVKSPKKGYVATMEAIATLKDQISSLLDEPQAPLQHHRALRAQIAELKHLRAVQARLEELEQLRVVRARLQELKQLRVAQARLEELKFLQTLQVRSTKEEEALVLEDSLHETLRELHASRGHNIFSSHFSR